MISYLALELHIQKKPEIQYSIKIRYFEICHIIIQDLQEPAFLKVFIKVIC